MGITQKDIARKLNLSRSMVGLVLSNHPRARVSEATRQQILTAAAEMGYTPNAAAKTLREGKTNVVTVADVFTGTSIVSPVWSVAQLLCIRGYRPSLCLLPSTEEMLAALMDIARSRSSDGMILIGYESEVEQMGMALERENIPFVAKGCHEERHPDWPQAEYDHVAMMEIAVSELWRRGRRNIACITYDDFAVYTHNQELGFRKAMKAHAGRDVDPSYIRRALIHDDSAFEAFEFWLSLPPEKQPTAAVVAAGTVGWQALELALARRGRTIGFGEREFAVIGMTTSKEVLDRGSALNFWLNLYHDIPEKLCQLLEERLKTGAVAHPVMKLLPPLQPALRSPQAAYYSELFSARLGNKEATK